MADTLNDDELPKLLNTVTATDMNPLIMRVAFCLSYYAGLRVQEIAGLNWRDHVLAADGVSFRSESFPVFTLDGRAERDKSGTLVTKQVPLLFISKDIGKYGSERTLRMHETLYENMQKLRGEFPEEFWVIPSGKPEAKQDVKSRAHALKMRINRLYDKMGMETFSSHSGRRSYITQAARRANAVGCSLRDVQVMAGHRSLVTTQRYIDVSKSQSDLTEIMWRK